MSKKLGITLLLIAMFCVSAAWSQIPPQETADQAENPIAGRPMTVTRPPQAANIDRVAVNLGLTETQSASLKAILTEYEKAVTPLLTRVTESSSALQTAIFAEGYDEAKVKELAAATSKVEVEVLNSNISAWTKIRAVLNQEQLAKLEENRRTQAGAAACFEGGPTGRGPGSGAGPGGGGPGTGRGPAGGGPGDGRGRLADPPPQ